MLLDGVRGDIRAGAGTSPVPLADAARILLNVSGAQALVAYRLGRWLRSARPSRWPLALALAPAYVLLTALVRVGFDIHLDGSAVIGPGLRIYHFGGIRVRACRVGSNCVLHHEVRLEPRAEGGAGPEIGDRVWIGPHARIVGPVRIGAGATIGAGAVVEHDVAPNTIVVGDPARAVRVDYDNSELVGRTYIPRRTPSDWSSP